MTQGWGDVLAEVARRLNPAGIDWVLLGSAAAAAHGVDIVPGDVDIGVADVDGVRAAAQVLPTPVREPGAARVDGPGVPADWISTVDEPVKEFGEDTRWTFGRWWMSGVKVELAFIDDPTATELLIETRSPLVFGLAEIDWQGERVPIVPIEIVLATMIARGLDDRVAATTAAIRHWDVDLLRRAMAARRAEGFTMALPDPVRRIVGADGDPDALGRGP